MGVWPSSDVDQPRVHTSPILNPPPLSPPHPSGWSCFRTALSALLHLSVPLIPGGRRRNWRGRQWAGEGPGLGWCPQLQTLEGLRGQQQPGIKAVLPGRVRQGRRPGSGRGPRQGRGGLAWAAGPLEAASPREAGRWFSWLCIWGLLSGSFQDSSRSGCTQPSRASSEACRCCGWCTLNQEEGGDLAGKWNASFLGGEMNSISWLHCLWLLLDTHPLGGVPWVQSQERSPGWRRLRGLKEAGVRTGPLLGCSPSDQRLPPVLRGTEATPGLPWWLSW